MKIALCVNLSKNNALGIADSAAQILLQNGAFVYMEDRFSSVFKNEKIKFLGTAKDIIEESDYTVVVGGDGTTMHYAALAAGMGKAVLGINAGRVGYISELEADETEKISALFSDNINIEKRMMIDITVTRNSKTVFKDCALNDAVLSRGSLSRIIDFEVSSFDASPCKYRADGLIFATPTGSTAYSLSAGGPVIDPEMSCILLSPVCPHMLSSARTIVFGSDTMLNVSFSNNDNELYLTIDGANSFKLEKDDNITIKKSDCFAKFIRIKRRNFYNLVNEKLVGGL